MRGKAMIVVLFVSVVMPYITVSAEIEASLDINTTPVMENDLASGVSETESSIGTEDIGTDLNSDIQQSDFSIDGIENYDIPQETEAPAESSNKFPSNSAELQSSFNNMITEMNGKMPTLEMPSIDSLRNELTESMKINAESTLKGMLGSSFIGLDSNLFGSSSLPEINREMLNVDYANMRQDFEKVSESLSLNSGMGSLDLGSLSISSGTDMGDIRIQMEEIRNSKQYQTVNGKISLSDVFGSLEKNLP